MNTVNLLVICSILAFVVELKADSHRPSNCKFVSKLSVGQLEETYKSYSKLYDFFNSGPTRTTKPLASSKDSRLYWYDGSYLVISEPSQSPSKAMIKLVDTRTGVQRSVEIETPGYHISTVNGDMVLPSFDGTHLVFSLEQIERWGTQIPAIAKIGDAPTQKIDVHQLRLVPPDKGISAVVSEMLLVRDGKIFSYKAGELSVSILGKDGLIKPIGQLPGGSQAFELRHPSFRGVGDKIFSWNRELGQLQQFSVDNLSAPERSFKGNLKYVERSCIVARGEDSADAPILAVTGTNSDGTVDVFNAKNGNLVFSAKGLTQPSTMVFYRNFLFVGGHQHFGELVGIDLRTGNKFPIDGIAGQVDKLEVLNGKLYAFILADTPTPGLHFSRVEIPLPQ